MSLEKIASVDDLKQVLTKTAGVCRGLAAENRELRAKNARFERREELEKIASEGVTRGVMDDADVDSFVERWSDDDTPLQVLGDFVERTTSGVPLGELGEGHEKLASADGDDVLTSFLTSQDPGSY